MFVYLKKSIDTDYKNLEIIRSKSVYHLIDNEFKGMYKNLEKTNIDWSKWDDTYEFIGGDDNTRKTFIKSNLNLGILSDLNLDFIIFVDGSGKILYKQGYDNFNNNKIPVKEIKMITKKTSNYVEKTGMLIGDNNKVFIFSNLKITDSKNVKKSNGNLIMGYFLNKNRVASIEKKLGIQLNMASISNRLEIPYEVKVGKDKIYNKIYISTLSGRSVAFNNQRNADILILGKKNVKKYVVMLFINFIILVFAIYIFMEHFIVKRLRKMDYSVREIIECQDLRKRLKVKGRDEIDNLGKNINNLLEGLEITKERLYSLATYDVMTGILNRYAGLEKLEGNFKRAKNNNEVFTIAFVDINDLKYVNDRYSHEEGDKLIKNIVEIIKKHLELEDIFLRFGGDEFILGFNRLNLLEIRLLFNEIEENLESYNNKSKKEYTHSISVGIVECRENKTLDEFINIADINMYENKKYKKKFPERKYVR
ncbi:MAG: hypothetical protein B6227_01045 [Fusobacteriia bacterium 4572_74]|nr:MAG: hypothetical protein B6227_01045 [Fusobacteriia bacterium 4572_74]